MSIESLKRTSDEIKTSNHDLNVLKQEEFFKNQKKRTCINALNQRLYDENKRDKNKNIVIICVVILSVGLFGFLVT
tara:strand:+ start:141 stop:368 length:228 start_codon:yes stop_codon:yes gene_type:complete